MNKQKQGEWKKGIWIPNNHNIPNNLKPDYSSLQVNNPKGNNQHTDKEKILPKREVLTELEAFERLTEAQQRELIGKLGNELYLIKRQIRPKLLAFNKYKEYYEVKHFGWKTEN